MTATTETRKRSREDDSCDSMPLSKRINNLHINNSLPDFAAASQNNLGQGANGSYQMQHGFNAALQGDNCYVSHISNGNDALEQVYAANYTPELNQHENPYYYNKNKLLYELHVERMRRTQQN